jgi:hypothetical protein
MQSVARWREQGAPASRTRTEPRNWAEPMEPHMLSTHPDCVVLRKALLLICEVPYRFVTPINCVTAAGIGNIAGAHRRNATRARCWPV